MTAAAKVAAFLGAPPSNIVHLDAHRVPELELGDAIVVVPPKQSRRPASAVAPKTSEAFERAWAVYPDGFHRSTRRLSWPQWVHVAAVYGEDRLEAAVGAYARDPRERETRAKHGAPGFQVWLRSGRYEHFIDAHDRAATPMETSPIPPAVFDAVAARWGEPYARSWLHQSRLNDAGDALAVRNGLAADKLADDCKRELFAIGVRTIFAFRDGVTVAKRRLWD